MGADLSAFQAQPAGLPDEPAITAHGLWMVYSPLDEQVEVLKGVDLQVQRGTVHVLMGPSGAGKTTLLLLLAGLLTPTAGQVCLLGQSLNTMSRHQLEQFRLHHVGFVSEELNLFPALTALENVAIALTLKGLSGHRAEAEALQGLVQVGLADRAHHLPRSLSGGQQQRVAIARAMVGHPTIVMADEPTAALDSKTGHQIMQRFRHLADEQGCTVCITTHDSRILEFADRVDYLEDGQLVSHAESLPPSETSAANGSAVSERIASST